MQKYKLEVGSTFFFHNTVHKTHFFFLKYQIIIFLSYYDTTLHSIQNNLGPRIFFYKEHKSICKDTEWNTEGKGVPVQPPYTEKEGTFPNNVISITEKRGNSCHGKKTNFMQ